MAKKKINTKALVMCALFSALICIGAWIKIPIPVVPFTLQVTFTTLAGLLLGSKWGATSVGVYLALGLMGIPVFTQGGGIGYVLKPTFGYLIGFMIGTYITGLIVEKAAKRTFWIYLFASIAGLMIVYLFGTVYCGFIYAYVMHTPLPLWTLILTCFLAPLPGDIFSCFLCALLAVKLVPILKRGLN